MFYVFEGIDGSGKSTQARILEEHFRREKRRVLCVREPGGTPLGETLRRLILEPGDEEFAPQTELFLFMAARAHLVDQRIEPALREGKIVISDRFLWSSAAYQSMPGGLTPEAILRVGELAVGTLNVTQTFFVDLDPQTALARTSSGDRMESRGVEFQAQVRENFLAIVEAHRDCATVIDGRGSPEEVHTRVLSHLHQPDQP